MISFIITIPEEFYCDLEQNHFTEYFDRMRADIDWLRENLKGYGVTGNYEDEITEMMREAWQHVKQYSEV